MERPALALVLSLAGCWTGAGAPVAAPAPAPSRPPAPDLELTLERGPCFGACPVFKLSLRGDGRVDWLGEEHVAAPGRRTGRIARADVEALERALDAARFFDRDQSGYVPREPVCVSTGTTRSCAFTSYTICSSTSHTILTVRRGRRSHRIDAAHCSDEDAALVELEEAILARTGAAAWLGR